ncbi:hypothetical protein [Nocardia terpenica]|uniref:Uncharacterized protein n=1 Tax=Nocardia terpenica TaxID=455432 RepID=A0A164JCA7_9NOCA|nr:hypothetical protein [Nocardia terpenica]KZM70262.1 hypothetical protein AWN90_06880 [Nocardia terpenica]NQE91703.1 hypothetical protein [Nocardia terpenica]
MNTDPTTPAPGPQLTLAHITGGCAQRNDVIVFAERHGVPLRYRLHIDNTRHQSYFLVEAYDPDRRQWNGLWTIPPATYTFDGYAWQEAAPEWPHIASPYGRDPFHKMTSWQKIIDSLTRYADRILAPPAPAERVDRARETNSHTDVGGSEPDPDPTQAAPDR